MGRAGERGGWLVLLVCTVFAAPSADTHTDTAETNESSALESPPKRAAAHAERASLIAHTPGARAVIVSMPDPEHAHTAVYFDEAIESMMSATQAAHWETVGHWLPWHVGKPDDKAPNVCCAAFATTDGDITPPAAGVLGFAKDGETLTVFLVGESQVGGVDRRMLNATLDELANEHYADASAPRVLGPFFSGSARSLFEVLNARTELRPRVVSGSATTHQFGAKLERGTFSRKTNDDDTLSHFVRDNLSALDARRRIATLTEESTQYGAGLTRDNDQYFFPLHIAQVASEHAKESKNSPQADAKRNLKHMLSLQFDDAAADEADIVPVFSKLTAFETELALRNTLLAIRDRGYRYLEVIATDPFDLVFVLQQAHLYCPNVQLITYGPHVLLSHPELMSDLSGTLVASNYPLFLETQNPTRGVTRSFPSETAEGIYNAMLELLSDEAADPAAPVSSGTGLATSHSAATDPALRELQRDVAPISKQPFAWLSILANGRFWPLRSTGAADLSPQSLRLPRLPRSVFLVLVLATLLTFVHASLVLIYYVRQRVCGRESGHTDPMQRWLPGPIVAVNWINAITFPCVPSEYAMDQYLTVAGMTLLSFDAGLLWSVWSYRIHWDQLSRLNGPLLWVSLVMAIFMLPLGGAVAWHVRRLGLGIARRWREQQYASASLGAVVIALSGGISVAWAGLVLELNRRDWLTALRSVQPGGICAFCALFFLALGIYVWAVAGLQRTTAQAAFPSHFPISEHAQNLYAEYQTLSTFRERDEQAPRHFELLALLVFIPIAAWFTRRLWPTFDGQNFDQLFTAVLLLLCFLVMLSALRFFVLYNHLRTLLRQLAAEPMSLAYDRIAKKVSGSFGIQLRSRAPAAQELEISELSSKSLASLAAELRIEPTDPIAQAIGARADALKDAVRSEHSRDRNTNLPQHLSHRSLFSVSHLVSSILLEVWQMRAEHLNMARFRDEKNRKRLEPGGPLANVPTITVSGQLIAPECLIWIHMAEDFVAMRHSTFIYHAISQLKSLLAVALTGAFLVASSVFAYPFQPSHFVRAFAALLVAGVVATTVVVVVGLQRDEILSRLAGTTPGEVQFNSEFIRNILVYAVLPMAAVLVRFFPELSAFLFTWLRPLSQLLA